MSKNKRLERLERQLRRHGRAGTYVVKAAESRPTRVEPRHSDLPTSVPTQQDYELARQLLALRRGGA